MNFPGVYNVSNNFTVIWLFGQFRWLGMTNICVQLQPWDDKQFDKVPQLEAMGLPTLTEVA